MLGKADRLLCVWALYQAGRFPFGGAFNKTPWLLEWAAVAKAGWFFPVISLEFGGRLFERFIHFSIWPRLKI